MGEGEMKGRICLVTGATSGIGRATALALGALGATVLIHGRNAERAEEVRSRVLAGGGTAEVVFGDLGSLRQVRQLAREVEQGWGRLDVLVNNAGVDLGNEREITEDGLERTFAVNYLAPFLLTNLLLPMLQRSAPARILTLGSGGQYVGRIDFDDLQGERHFSGQRAYDQSKLALVVFTYALARRVAGTGVTVNCVDPGLVKDTALGEEGSFGVRIAARVLQPFMSTPERGAETVVWAASAPELADANGEYLKNRKTAHSAAKSKDLELGARLWEVSTQLTGTENLPERTSTTNVPATDR
ncbi:MAG: SDR family oxidoreductase [Candidatus Dormiibacterota bacterium]